MNIKTKLIIVNSLTLIRFIISLFIIPIYFNYGSVVTAFIIGLTYLTDFLDGFLARKMNCSSFFGSLFDGVCDKIFNIVNLIIFLNITPIALIVIILEVGIFIINVYKYSCNMVIKANKIGKFKMWVIGLSMFMSLLLVNILSLKEITYLLIPLIIIEIITFFSYLIEIKRGKVREKKMIKDNVTLKEILFSPSFYEENKNILNLRIINNYFKQK